MTLRPSPDHPLPWHVCSWVGPPGGSYAIFAKNNEHVASMGIGARAKATADYIVAAANAFPDFRSSIQSTLLDSET